MVFVVARDGRLATAHPAAQGGIMFTRRVELFRLMGFAVHVDASWLILAVLMTWSLAVSVFPAAHADLATRTHWIMGACAMIGLFASILLHELAHALVARGYGIPMKGITLFIFGGVAEMESEPRSGSVEFPIAAAGPFASAAMALACFGLERAGLSLGWPAAVNGVLEYLGLINLVLVAFNLVPAFPLDGGRMLRAGLWGWTGNLHWATRVSASLGAAFGLLLIAVGFLVFAMGNFIGGLWWFLIGMFLRNAAQMSYQQVLIRGALEGETVASVMHPDPVTVSPLTTVRQLVEDYMYRHHHKMFPVVRNGDLLGCVTLQNVRHVPRAEWDERHVSDLVQGRSPENLIDASEDAIRALSKMSRTGRSRMMVTQGGRLVGVIARSDLLRLLALKIELQEDHPWRAPEMHLLAMD
jgi:Zn-dependent protease/predicted transcriptional regulator